MATNTLLGPVLRAIVLSALGVLTIVGTASGAVYRTRYDPSFGEPYPNLGFRGTADFAVDDACLAGDGGWKADGGCGEMSLLSATVELYDAGSVGQATIDTLVFAPPVPEPDPILGVFVQFTSETGRNEVVGLDTTIFGPQNADVPGIYTGPLWLQFISGQMPSSDFTAAVLSDFSTSALITGVGGAFIYAATCPTVEEESTSLYNSYGYHPPQPQECSDTPDFQSNLASNITFERLDVPEPGSLALIFGGLGAGWLARRKMRKA